MTQTETTTRRLTTTWELRDLLTDRDSLERNLTLQFLQQQEETRQENLRWEQLYEENERCLRDLELNRQMSQDEL